MSSIDRSVMLEALGWFRGGEKNNHLPDDIMNIIHQFTFFDVRTKAYSEHCMKKNVKVEKLNTLDHMMFQINDGLRRIQTGTYGVEYNSINVKSNCCSVCGDFIPVLDPIPENIRCSCSFLTEEDIEKLENEHNDVYYWEEEQEDVERDRERKIKNRKFDEKFGDEYHSENHTYYLEDDIYSDRKPNWDEGSECSLDYDYCDDDNSYF
jgi:hypothetical protein